MGRCGATGRPGRASAPTNGWSRTLACVTAATLLLGVSGSAAGAAARPRQQAIVAAAAARVASTPSNFNNQNWDSPPQCYGREYPLQGPALRAIYNHLGGDAWTRNTNWTSTDNICAFEGTSCDDSCYIEALSLPDNNVVGTLFDGMLDNLPMLFMLDLSENAISGTLPPHLLRNNANLMHLQLSHNQFSGTIPAWELPADLKHLHLAVNNLEGSVPVAILQLLNAETIDLGGNLLSGTLPWTLGASLGLRVFNVAGNSLTGRLPDFSNNTQLISADFSYNQFIGEIPDVSRLTQLEALQLQFNSINGSFPAELGFLPKLEVLHLRYNKLSCTIPEMNASAFALSKDGDVTILEGNGFNCPIPDALIAVDPQAGNYYCGMGLELYLSPAACALVYVLGVLWHATPSCGTSRRGDAKAASVTSVSTAPTLGSPASDRARGSRRGMVKEQSAAELRDDAAEGKMLTAQEAIRQLMAMGELSPGTEAVSYLRFARMSMYLALAVAVVTAPMMLVYQSDPADYECRDILRYTAAFVVSEGNAVGELILHVLLVLVAIYFMYRARRMRRRMWGAAARASTDRSLSARYQSDKVEKLARQGTCANVVRRTKLVATVTACIIVLLTPNVLYVWVMNNLDLPAEFKQFASVALAFANAFGVVVVTPAVSSWVVETLGRPRTLKRRFEYKVRLAGLLTVIAATVAPVVSTLLLDRDCFWYLLDSPADAVVQVPERICWHVSNFTTHTCEQYYQTTYDLALEFKFEYDERCPSHVLYLYGVVFMHTMIVQGLFVTGIKLMQDTALGRRIATALINKARAAVCLPPTESHGIQSDAFLRSLLSKYNQIVSVMSVVLVYGSLYPLVALVAFVATVARVYADSRLVRRGMVTGAHREWEPQGARGLPMTSFGVVLFAYAGFIAWFYGMGLMDTSKTPIGYVVAIEALLGLVLMRLGAFDACSRCLRKVSATVNNERFEGSPKYDSGPYMRTSSEMALLSDYEAAEAADTIPAHMELHPDEFDARPSRSSSTGSMGAALDRLRNASFGNDSGGEGDAGFDAKRDDSLRGVGGRVLVRGEYAPRTSSRRPTTGAAARHRSDSSHTGAGAWGGPSPFLSTLVEPEGASHGDRWRPEGHDRGRSSTMTRPALAAAAAAGRSDFGAAGHGRSISEGSVSTTSSHVSGGAAEPLSDAAARRRAWLS